jgi:N-acetylmuramoyl-L-alanine amidase
MTPPLIALIVGHEPKAPGATSCGHVSEFDWNTQIAAEVQTRLAQSQVVRLVRVWRAPEGYSALPGKVNATGADAAVELHFNASNGAGRGTECLHFAGSKRGEIAALLFQTMIVEALGLRDRGLKPCAASDRGGLFLAKTNMPAVIVEPFFGDNALDWQRATARRADLVRAYATALEELGRIIRAGWNI